MLKVRGVFFVSKEVVVGEARRRGTFEERIAQSVERKRVEAEKREFYFNEQQRLDQWHFARLTVDARRRNLVADHRARMLAAQMVGMYSSFCVPRR